MGCIFARVKPTEYRMLRRFTRFLGLLDTGNPIGNGNNVL